MHLNRSALLHNYSNKQPHGAMSFATTTTTPMIDMEFSQHIMALPIIILNFLLSDFSVKWPKTAEAMACLMHHKFILIDAEPISDGYSTSDDEDEGVDANVPLGVPCELCSDMASDVKNSDKCVQCRPLRIRSKEDLIKFPSEVLPRLPKHGLLITGSLNWSQQVT